MDLETYRVMKGIELGDRFSKVRREMSKLLPRFLVTCLDGFTEAESLEEILYLGQVKGQGTE